MVPTTEEEEVVGDVQKSRNKQKNNICWRCRISIFYTHPQCTSIVTRFSRRRGCLTKHPWPVVADSIVGALLSALFFGKNMWKANIGPKAHLRQSGPPQQQEQTAAAAKKSAAHFFRRGKMVWGLIFAARRKRGFWRYSSTILLL